MKHKKALLLGILLLTSFLYIFPIPAQKLDDDTALKIEEYLSTGKSLYRQDKFQEAIEVWQKVLEIDPANSQAQRYIERARERLQELQPPTVPKEEPALIPEKIAPEIKPPPSIATTVPAWPAGRLPGFTPLAEKPARLLTLKECIQIAVDNSISLKTAKREVRLAKQKLKDAWRALFPAASVKWEEISGTTTGEDFKGREFYLELQQPIYQGGRLANTLKQARINMQVARHNYQKLKNDLVYEVEQAFHILASTKKIYRELLELITLAKKDYSVAEKERELELQREIDFLNVKNLYQETEYKLLSYQKDLTLAYLTLYQTLNIDQKKQSIDIPEPPSPQILEIKVDDCQKIALENRPDLKIKDLLFKFNKYGLLIARSGNRFKIDLTAAGGYKDEVFITEDLDLQTEWYVGLKGSIPIWLNTAEYSFISQDKVPSAGQTTSTEFQSHTATLKLFDNTAYTSITEAIVNLQKAKDELQKLEKSVTFETKQDFYEYEKAVYQLSNSSTKLRLSEVELAIVAAQRDLNLAATNDLLRTRIKLWEAKTSYHQANAGYFTSVAKLNKTIGISEYFNPMGEAIVESAFYISPPPLDISIAKLEITPAVTGKPTYEKSSTQLAVLEDKVQPEKKSIEPIADTKELCKQNFGPRKSVGESEIDQEEQRRKEEEKHLAQLKKAEAEARRRREEEQKKRDEEKRLAELKKQEEQRKQEEDQKRLAQEKEQKRLAELKRQEKLRKQEEERQRLAREKEEKRLAEQRRREEERRIAQLKKAEEQKKRDEEKRLAELKRRDEQRKQEEERQRQVEEKRLAELKRQEEKRKQEEEQKILAQEREQKKVEELKRKEEEKRLAQLKKEKEQKKQREERRLVELKRQEEEKKQEEERQRLAKEREEKQLEEQRCKEEEKRLAQLKKEEEQKKHNEEKRLAELKRREEQKKQEEERQRLAKEKEQKKLEEQIRIERERYLAQLKKEEEQRKQEEERRLAQLKKEEEQKKRNEEKRLAELKRQEEQRKQEEEKQRLAKEREEKEIAEKIRKEQENILAELKKEEEVRKKSQSQIVLIEEEQATSIIPEKELDEYARAKILAAEIAKRKAEEENNRVGQILLAQEKEQEKLAQEREKKRMEEQRRKEEEKRLEQLKKERERQKKEEERRLAELKRKEEQRKQEEERQRLAKEKEEKRLVQLKKEEEQKKREEERRIAELKRQEEQRKQKEEERLAKGSQIEPAQQISSTTESIEYQSAKTKTEEKLSQLEKEKTALLTKLENIKTTQKEEINQYLYQAEEYYKKQDYTSAIKEWSKALAMDFTNIEAQEGVRKAEEELRKNK